MLEKKGNMKISIPRFIVGICVDLISFAGCKEVTRVLWREQRI